MPKDEPIARLPDEIVLDLAEAKTVLIALDQAEGVLTGQAREVARGAIRIITRKLWPDLGDLLDEE